MSQIKLQSVVWKEDKHFVAQCLNVDISSFGESKNEAIQNLKEALDLYFEDTPTLPITTIEQPEIVTQLVENG